MAESEREFGDLAARALAKLASETSKLSKAETDRNWYQQAVHDIGDALDYPADHRGRQYDLRFLKHLLCYHLPRAGIGKVDGKAVIKKRRLPPSPGVYDDAVEWVPLDAPPSVDDELAGRSLDNLDGLSRAARAEAIRRLGGDGAAVNPEQTGWHVETSIHLDDLTEDQ